MRRALLTIVAILLLEQAHSALAQVVVVVNPDSPIARLTRTEVVDLYMGRRTDLPNGRIALPIDLPPDSPLRAAYYRALVDKTVSQVNAYWARLLFTGRATPPRVVPDTESVLQTISDNRDAIGYLDQGAIDSRVKVVLELD